MRALYLGEVRRKGPMGGHLRLPMIVAKYLRELSDGRVESMPEEDALVADLSKYDVVHGPGLAQYARRARKAGAKYVMTVPNSWTEGVRHGWQTGRGGVYRLGQAAVYAKGLTEAAIAMRLSDAMAVSAATARGLLQQSPWERHKIFLSEYATDPAQFTPDGATDEGFILFVGRLERVKGIDTLVDALSGKADRVVVAGTGSLEAAMRARAGSNFEFRGEVSDEELLSLFRSASMCVLPSTFEGFGLVALESLSCGLPTAVTGGFGFRLEPPASDLAEWFAPGDVEGLRGAVERMRGKKTPEWSARAHDLILKHHHVRDQAAGLLRLYESLAAGEGVPGAPATIPSDPRPKP